MFNVKILNLDTGMKISKLLYSLILSILFHFYYIILYFIHLLPSCKPCNVCCRLKLKCKLLYNLICKMWQCKLALIPNSLCSKAPIPFCGDVPIKKTVSKLGVRRLTGMRRHEWLTWLDRTYFFCVHCTSFQVYSPLLTSFLCFIVLFQSCCSVFTCASVWESTHAWLVSSTFSIAIISHTEWNLFSLLYYNSENILDVECY